MTLPQNTKDHIVRSAIEVLKARGTEGLTMRKVAAHAQMSLGNLQYHFKDKTSLMAGLADHYFDACTEILDRYPKTARRGTREEQFHRFILFLLDHVDHISDMCRIFREMWALSARDREIHRRLVEYYGITFNKLCDLTSPLSGSKESAETIASLLLPYIEGYSITCEALPMGKHETARILARLCHAASEDASSITRD